jgi:predicted glycoside hydrolase/deacetylase ChbG (UPF0249 family)
MAAAGLIINADDAGLAPAVDDGILAAWAQGAISGATAFATSSRLTTLVGLTRVTSLPLGIHLNLTWGTPCCAPEEIPALVDATGQLMKRTQWTQPLPIAQVRAELTRQIEHALALGMRPTHLDSHHHVHAYPEVLAVVIDLARAHDLPVRAPSPEIRDALRAAGLHTPDHFSMTFYGEAATVETLIRLVDECPGGVLEIMTHPGKVDPTLPSSYREARAQELAVLTAPAWREYRQAQGIALLRYAEL